MASSSQLTIPNIWFNDYMTLATITAVGYDYILMFPDEVEYIWNMHWTRISTLYVLARYFGVFSIVINSLWGSTFVPGPIETCDTLYILDTWCPLVFMAAADLAMILRVWALYNKSKIVLGIFLTLYAIEIVINLVFCIAASAQIQPLASTIRVLDYSYCIEPPGSSVWPAIVYIVQIILGAMMCLLSGRLFFSEIIYEYRETGCLRLNRYVTLLAREGVVYFLAILTYALLNVLVSTGAVPPNGRLAILAGTMNYALAITLVPRFMLNLRKLYSRSLEDTGEMDTGFGMTLVAGQDSVGSRILFANMLLHARSEQGEGIEMDEMVDRSA